MASVSISAVSRNPHFGFTTQLGEATVAAPGELGAVSPIIPARMEAVRVPQQCS